MSSIWEQRAARNEALFREVNENIAELEERFDAPTSEPVFICECSSTECTESLAVDLGEYQRARKNPRRFLVLPGHHDPRVERVVETHADYVIVEKIGEAGDVAEQTQG